MENNTFNKMIGFEFRGKENLLKDMAITVSRPCDFNNSTSKIVCYSNGTYNGDNLIELVFKLNTSEDKPEDIYLLYKDNDGNITRQSYAEHITLLKMTTTPGVMGLYKVFKTGEVKSTNIVEEAYTELIDDKHTDSHYNIIDTMFFKFKLGEIKVGICWN